MGAKEVGPRELTATLWLNRSNIAVAAAAVDQDLPKGREWQYNGPL